jgi:hypothetical protein
VLESGQFFKGYFGWAIKRLLVFESQGGKHRKARMERFEKPKKIAINNHNNLA